MTILLKFPELLAAPLFNPVTFGRVGDLEELRGKVSFSLRWTFVNMVVTVCGITALAVYVATRSEDEIKWSSTYILTLLMVMCIAMVWMVPLMVAAKNPDNILSIMYQARQIENQNTIRGGYNEIIYQRGVLDLGNPCHHLMLKWDKEKQREEVVVERGGTLLKDMMIAEFRGQMQKTVEST